MKTLLTLAICTFLATPALAAFEGPGAAAPESGAQKADVQKERIHKKDFNGKKDFDRREDRGGEHVRNFSGPFTGAEAETVAKALTLADDARVLLTGHIVSQYAGSRDKFTFRDDTGEVMVEIGRKAFRGQTVTPGDTVRISGKVDKDMGKPVEIDVKFLEVLKK